MFGKYCHIASIAFTNLRFFCQDIDTNGKSLLLYFNVGYLLRIKKMCFALFQDLKNISGIRNFIFKNIYPKW